MQVRNYRITAHVINTAKRGVSGDPHLLEWCTYAEVDSFRSHTNAMGSAARSGGPPTDTSPTPPVSLRRSGYPTRHAPNDNCSNASPHTVLSCVAERQRPGCCPVSAADPAAAVRRTGTYGVLAATSVVRDAAGVGARRCGCRLSRRYEATVIKDGRQRRCRRDPMGDGDRARADRDLGGLNAKGPSPGRVGWWSGGLHIAGSRRCCAARSQLGSNRCSRHSRVQAAQPRQARQWVHATHAIQARHPRSAKDNAVKALPAIPACSRCRSTPATPALVTVAMDPATAGGFQPRVAVMEPATPALRSVRTWTWTTPTEFGTATASQWFSLASSPITPKFVDAPSPTTRISYGGRNAQPRRSHF